MTTASASPTGPAKPEASAWLKWHVGPDSNACGVTAPASMPAKAAALPVVLWLHGGMRSAQREKGFTAHRAALDLVSDAKTVLVSPSAHAGADWLSEAGMRHIDACLDQVFARFPAANRRSLWALGVSDGTLGVIRYSLSGHYPLARRVLISTYPDLALPPEQVGQAPRLAAGTWDIFVGGRDRLFPSGPVMQSLAIWKRSLPALTLHFEPEGEHDVSWWFQHQKPRVIRALVGHE